MQMIFAGMLFAFLVGAAQAADRPSFKAATCGAQAEALARKWGAQDSWRASAPDLDGATSFRAPSRDFGAWIVARWLPNGQIEMNRVSTGSLVRARWLGAAKTCVPTLQTSVPKAFTDRSADSWTDERLATLIQQGKRGFVYVWSPHMPYSVKGLRELPAMRKRLGGAEIVVMLDPAARQAAAEQTIRKHAFPKVYMARFNSIELYMRDALVHAPALLPFAGKKLGSRLLPGYRKIADVESFLKREWKAL
jgi:hypothetical protein